MLRFRFLGCIGILLLTARAALGSLLVSATVTPLGGSFRYEFSITNTMLNSPGEDVVIVSLTDAPPGDSLIEPSLATPPGFIGLYDSGLGIVDFVEDTTNFAAGTTMGGFFFESQSSPGPGVFSAFSALTVDGDTILGDVKIRVVPEPGSWLAVGLMLGMLCLFLRCSQRRNVICTGLDDGQGGGFAGRPL